MRSRFVPGIWSLLLLFTLPLIAQPSVAGGGGALSDADRLFRKADFRGAADAFRKVIQSQPQPSPEAYSGLVRSLLKADDVKAAEESSQKALAALPESALVHVARGDVYLRRGLIQQAEQEYSAALKLDDKSSRAWLGQGKVDAVYTRHSKAKAAIAKAHDLDPDDGD